MFFPSLRMLGPGPWRKNDSILLVDGLVGTGDLGEQVVADIQLLIDTVEECLAEGTALEVGDDTVQQLHARVDGLVVGMGERAVGEDAEPAFEGVNAVHVEQGQALLAKHDLILEDRLLHEILIGLAFILAAVQRVGPALAQRKLLCCPGDGPFQYSPRWRVEGCDWNDHEIGRLSGGIGFATAN
jgi:hypothetical protein